jgi:hypothetical protein
MPKKSQPHQYGRLHNPNNCCAHAKDKWQILVKSTEQTLADWADARAKPASLK